MILEQGHLLCDDCTGELTISGTSLNDDPRWCAYDLSDLWADEATRGQNEIMPGVPGRRPFIHRKDETRYLLPFAVTGWVDSFGEAVDDSLAQSFVRSALGEIKAAVVGPIDNDDVDGTRPAIYETPDGETWYQSVQTLSLRKRRTTRGLWIGHLELVLPQPWDVVS
jgi:hypothetical protein